jgi:xylulokinase
MMDLLLAGIDIGTTSIKLSLYNLKGMVVFEECEEYPTYYRRPGWAEQSPNDWKKVILSLFRKLSVYVRSSSYKIGGLGFSVHAPSLIFLDEYGSSLQDFVPIWCDERSAEKAEKLLERVGPDFVGLGLPLASFPAKLLWYMEERPDEVKKAILATGIKGYLLKWLTGELATDPSSEPGQEDRWRPIMPACGWSVDKLPPLFEPTRVIGNVCNEVLQKANLSETFPVVVGLNDGSCSILSTGAYQNKDATLELATNGVFYLVSDRPMPLQTCAQHAFFCWNYLDGRWIIGGQTKCGASAFDWANELFGAESIQGIEKMIEIAQAGPVGSNGIMFFPYLRGRGTPADNPNARGMIAGLGINTAREHLYRAIIEGVVISIHEIVEYLQRANFTMERVFITGGGAKSGFVRQIAADILGIPLYWSQTRATLGAAILAAVGVGIYEDITTALSQMSPPAIQITPDLEAHEAYNDFNRRYSMTRDYLLAMY